MNGLFQIWNKKITAIGALGSEQSKLCKSFTDFQWQKRNIGTPLGSVYKSSYPAKNMSQALQRSPETRARTSADAVFCLSGIWNVL